MKERLMNGKLNELILKTNKLIVILLNKAAL